MCQVAGCGFAAEGLVRACSGGFAWMVIRRPYTGNWPMVPGELQSGWAETQEAADAACVRALADELVLHNSLEHGTLNVK